MKAESAVWEELAENLQGSRHLEAGAWTEVLKMGTYQNGGGNVLGKQNTLGLNDEEVDELMNVANGSVESLLGNRVVLAGPELCREAVVHEELASRLGRDGDGEDHPCELEGPPEDVEVPNRENEGDNRGICNGGSP